MSKNPGNPYHRVIQMNKKNAMIWILKNPHYDSETPEILLFKELDTAYARLNGAFKAHLCFTTFFFKMCLIKHLKNYIIVFYIWYYIISMGFGGDGCTEILWWIFASCWILILSIMIWWKSN